MLFLLLSVFGGWAAFAPIQTFFSSYAVNSLDLTISESARIFAVAIISFIIFAIPAAYIARVIGRRKAIIAGMGLFGVVMLGAWMTLNVTFIIILLALSGIAFALMSTNMLPMVVDVHKDLRLIGTYTGLYYFATQSADVISPVLAGWAIDLSGRNFQAIYLVAALFVGMAFVCMLFVSHGEPQGSEGTMEYQGR
jgi:MFS family permease